jgi:hypothetical protein
VLALLVPVFSLITDPFKLFDFLFVEGVAFKIVVLGFIQLGQVLKPVILQKVAQSGDVVHDADFFDFIDIFGVGETYQVWTDCKLFAV